MRRSLPTRLSLSSWAMHSWLGESFPDSPGERGSGRLTAGSKLWDLPGEMVALGILNLELCHFHVPMADLAAFAAACRDRGIRTYQLLIDDGDLSSLEFADRDEAWILEWLGAASAAGFERARIITGKSGGPADYERVFPAVDRLSRAAEELGVRLVFENWFPVMSTVENVRALHAGLEGRGGLCFDFGNWSGDDKHERLAQIADLAESSHAKCQFANGEPDRVDFLKCLEILRTSGFAGPLTIVHGEPDALRGSIELQHELIAEVFPDIVAS